MSNSDVLANGIEVLYVFDKNGALNTMLNTFADIHTQAEVRIVKYIKKSN